jgi:hypothetical protein
VPGKPVGERIAKTELLLVAHTEVCEGHWKSIDDHLARLNGDVAENSKFRVQQKAVYGVIAFAWVSVLIPMAAIAVAVLA